MISLQRNRSEAAVHSNFTGDTKSDFERDLLINHRAILRGDLEKHSFNSNRWKAAKEQMINETHGKCSYCEAPFSLVSYGDVEHFRPKSKYWWLAYSYENFLVSCQLCNQKFKKASFPKQNRKLLGPRIRRNTSDERIERLAGNIAPDPLDPDEVIDFIEDHRDERPLLLNPYFDDPTEYYGWQIDDNLEEVELIPIPSNPDSAPFVRAAINYYGLNRLELKQARYNKIANFRLFKSALRDPGISDGLRIAIETAVEEMQDHSAPFAGMIRYFDRIL